MDSFSLCPIGFELILSFMPELEELQVTTKRTAQLARKLLLDLTMNADGNSNFCPRLHTIHLYSVKGIDKHVFLEFIKSRRPMDTLNQCVKPNRSVRLTMEIKVEESDKVFLEELEVLRDEGINIVIN
jgi:hypothetical protein